MTPKKKVMVFGVFDGLHPGHESFLKQARKCGEYLVAVVARDENVLKMKGERPVLTQNERIEQLVRSGLADEVVSGDEQEGSWQVLDEHKPAVVALGYDQQSLKSALEIKLAKSSFSCTLVIMEPHEPDKYKSSIMNRHK